MFGNIATLHCRPKKKRTRVDNLVQTFKANEACLNLRLKFRSKTAMSDPVPLSLANTEMDGLSHKIGREVKR